MFKVWDLGRPEHALFRAKNVRPDMLELRQEVSEMLHSAFQFEQFNKGWCWFSLMISLNQVWVSDIAWLCPNTVGVCSRHGEIRRC